MSWPSSGVVFIPSRTPDRYRDSVPLLDAREPLSRRPHRILVGGTSGSGKGWTVRSTFAADVEELAAQPEWITEYPYADARPVLLGRCDLVVYLALTRSVVMRRVIARTIRRSIKREQLWNGNVEPPLRTVMTDPDHIVRWAWKTHRRDPERIDEILSHRPEVAVVVLRSPRQIDSWLRRVITTELR